MVSSLKNNTPLHSEAFRALKQPGRVVGGDAAQVGIFVKEQLDVSLGVHGAAVARLLVEVEDTELQAGVLEFLYRPAACALVLTAAHLEMLARIQVGPVGIALALETRRRNASVHPAASKSGGFHGFRNLFHHLLVAGATGQGKSVGLNAVITSLLYKKHPAELKLVMVDPKMVEFSIYAPIVKHFLAKMPDETDAIITDTTKVIHTLKSLCIEMDNRYELLKNANVRSVIEYNNLFKDRKLNPEKGHRYLPYIVVVIDEFGDLIMTAGKDIEMPIARIAQKARAVGMHMIIATQRPTTNIITGTIKANFPARMAFRVSSMIDSRTILDRPGANQLIGRGDLLFLSGSDPVRVQCAFVDTPEVNAICQYISHQQGYTDAYPLPEYVDENEAGAMDGGMEMGKFDPMFAEAARLVVVNQSGSTSLIQRKFSIGYNRAGRLMDQLEATGIVGRADGSKPRPVLVTDEVQLDRILETYNLL